MAEDSLDHLKELVARDQVRDALALLNAQTDHRFSALYRFDRQMLRNMYFYDRMNPGLLDTDDLPIMASYCVYVRDGNRAFETTHARDDPRTEGHPKRQVLQAYVGVPMLGEDGRAIGTVCHFDYDPRSLSVEGMRLTEAFAALFPIGGEPAGAR